MKIAGYEVHPAAELFPLTEGEELEQLADDIRKKGLLEPVWLCPGENGNKLLLDGRNRARACEIAGVALKTRTYKGPDPIAFSVSQNLHRRHLTTGQKAGIAYNIEPLYAEEAAKRKAHGATAPGRGKETLVADRRQASGGGASGSTKEGGQEPDENPSPRERKSGERAAKLTGTSGRALARYKRIRREAPDLADKVDAGAMALDRADRIIRDRKAEAKRIEEAKRQAASAPRQPKLKILHGDFREVLADLQNVDAIITDPPYPKEYLPLLNDLASWADRVLAPDGLLAVLMGQTYLPEVYRRLDGGRPYRWTGCYITSGAGYVSHPRKVQSNWKPLLVYGGGRRFSDVVRSEGNDAAAKSNHKWGQDYRAFHTIIERLTDRDSLVVDPFMGSGTTLVAAHALGRDAIGCDTDEESVRRARERIG